MKKKKKKCKPDQIDMILARLERIAAECCCELRLTDGSIADLARAIVDADDPPRGEDYRFCREIADGDAIVID